MENRADHSITTRGSLSSVCALALTSTLLSHCQTRSAVPVNSPLPERLVVDRGREPIRFATVVSTFRAISSPHLLFNVWWAVIAVPQPLTDRLVLHHHRDSLFPSRLRAMQC